MADEPRIHVEVAVGSGFAPSVRLRDALSELANALAAEELVDEADVAGFALPGAASGTGLSMGPNRPPMRVPVGKEPLGWSGCISYCPSDANCSLCGINFLSGGSNDG